MKLVFPYRGTLRNGPVFGSPLPGSGAKNPENTLWVLGISDRPWIVDADGPFGVLSVEFHPGAAYPFFPCALKDLSNLVLPAPDVFGEAGRLLQNRLAEEPGMEGKVRLVQSFLLGFFGNTLYADSIVPKTLAEIVRFQNRFVHLTRFGSAEGSIDFDDDYYDQSHFTKEFKRFSGLPPAAYLKASNEFLKLFYGGTQGAHRAD
jgi:hypothetical protein